jgi:radical SAM superfamily enzyme YgiQ (UPF0313 family)
MQKELRCFFRQEFLIHTWCCGSWANLLPFTLQATAALRERFPDRTLILGGVGSKAVEDKILRRFPAVDIICRGEAEQTGPELLRALKSRKGRSDTAALRDIAGISYRDGNEIRHNPNRARIRELDGIPFPAFHKIKLKEYAGYGMMTSRGCPYPCTFCSVAPVWNLESYSRSAKNIVEEMRLLNREAGVDLFLFQDEFFVSGKRQVMEFCRELTTSKLGVEWKAFGRVNLTDVEMMKAMADSGCLELRFGIESGSDRVLKIIKKGFTASESLDLIPKAVEIFPRVDAFFVWGFPFETMEDFNQSLFQMVSFRMLGARILPSLLSLLPQTEIYRDYVENGNGKGGHLEFCPYLLPEFVFTGHEICQAGEVQIPERYQRYFKLISDNPDLFPGFFHIDLKNNVLPKLDLLRQFGFYPRPKAEAEQNKESCGAHSPRIEPQELATRAGRQGKLTIDE